ncbi:DMT family transporter [Aeoliella sp. ICT_H6.2]|uniref:DMT family transporter n=1 Tax=Aeoliella straminimaris TaxID=2954799 RepID=A0A9X2FJR0_9BACT|nr:DMT family transporter [Aeoliella straminimaris]MCO6047731.1 DMT family transporter [Aeoliella straminimaris]
MAYVYFAIVCLVFGSNFKLMDNATQVLGPNMIALGRLWGGTLVLLPVLLAKGESLKVDRPTLVRILFVAMVGNAYPFAVQPWILSHGADHSFLAVFVPMTPLLTIVAAVPMLGVRPTWQQAVGVLVGFGLLMWMVFHDSGSHNFPEWLVPFAMTVPLGYAVGNVFLRRNLRGVPSLVTSSLLLLCAGFILLPGAVYEIATHPIEADASQWQSAIIAMLILGPVGTGLCIYLFVVMVQDRGPLFAGMVTYVVPPVALMWGYRDGEAITTPQLLGIAGILVMVALVQSSQGNYATRK